MTDRVQVVVPDELDLMLGPVAMMYINGGPDNDDPIPDLVRPAPLSPGARPLGC